MQMYQSAVLIHPAGNDRLTAECSLAAPTHPQSGAGHHRVSGSMDSTLRNMKSSNLSDSMSFATI